MDKSKKTMMNKFERIYRDVASKKFVPILRWAAESAERGEMDQLKYILGTVNFILFDRVCERHDTRRNYFRSRSKSWLMLANEAGMGSEYYDSIIFSAWFDAAVYVLFKDEP